MDKKLLNIIQFAIGILVLITFLLPAIEFRNIITQATRSYSGSEISLGYSYSGYVVNNFNFLILILYFIPALTGLIQLFFSEKSKYIKYVSITLNLLVFVGFILVVPVLFQPVGGNVIIDGLIVSRNFYTRIPSYGLIASMVFTLFLIAGLLVEVYYDKITNKA